MVKIHSTGLINRYIQTMKKVLFSFWTNLASFILLWSSLIATALFCIANDKNPKYFEIGEVFLEAFVILITLHILFQLFLWVRVLVSKKWRQFWAFTLMLFLIGIAFLVTYSFAFAAIVLLVGLPASH